MNWLTRLTAPTAQKYNTNPKYGPTESRIQHWIFHITVGKHLPLNTTAVLVLFCQIQYIIINQFEVEQLHSKIPNMNVKNNDKHSFHAPSIIS